jgi:hypothetical protein
VADDLRRRLVVSLDVDAVQVILRTGGRADMPPSLGDAWAARWDGPAIAHLRPLSQGDRQDALHLLQEGFLHDPRHGLVRATFAASQAPDPDLRLAGTVALTFQDVLVAFGREIRCRAVSPRTGKVKYAVLTDIDVETTRAVIEVSTQDDAAGKVGQLTTLLGPEANPLGKAVFHYLPRVGPATRPALALGRAGSAGVFANLAALRAAVDALGGP